MWCITPQETGFNPLPAVKPGDAIRHFEFAGGPVVSIHSRRLSREMPQSCATAPR